MTTISNYYCNQKFWWLTVNLERLEIQSCCAATPEKIQEQNLHKDLFFNTELLQQERQEMLDNVRVKSCATTCWIPQENNLPNRRTTHGGDIKTHTNIVSQPEHLNLILGKQCGMMCVYCCKQYSSTWIHEIKNNGPFMSIDNGNRYAAVSDKDLLLLKISQNQITQSPMRQQIIDLLPSLTEKVSVVEITGGEPFLYTNLIEIVSVIPKRVKVDVWSGLGVDTNRFKKYLDQLSAFPNVTITISAESINSLYEFIRSGNSWDRFTTNLELIKNKKIKYKFNATLTNLSVIGINEFYQFAGDVPVSVQPCTEPEFLSINVLDNNTKNIVKDNLSNVPQSVKDIILKTIEKDARPDQINNFKNYIKEFASRRSQQIPEQIAGIFE